jgi:hypothetical protein
MRIIIICARTWGQMGNLLAAQRLAEMLKIHMVHGSSIEVRPAEELCPGVARTGQCMLEIASTSSSQVERRERYLALIEELQAEYPPGFECDAETIDERPDVRSLAEFLKRHEPDLIIGTKGFLSRLAEAAVRYLGINIPIVNYVTNDGLLTLPLHHTSRAILSLVQTEFGARMLSNLSPFKIVGPLVGRCSAGDLSTDQDQRPHIAILCNRNPEYRQIYDALAECGDAIRVRTIVMGCPELLADLQLHGPAHWDILDAQLAKNYLEMLAELRTASAAMLVTKSSPNAVLEAVSVGLPVLALDSGLPMEQWMLQLIEQRQLGWPAQNTDQAVSILHGLASEPNRIVEMSDSVRKFATNSLDNDQNIKNVYDSISFRLNDYNYAVG